MSNRIRHLTGRLHYALPAAAVLAGCAVLTSCGSAGPGSSGSGSSSGTGYSTGSTSSSASTGSTTSSSDQTTDQATVQTAQLWGPDSCLHNYVTTAAGDVLSDTATDLCRSATTLSGQTAYYVFARGDSSAWVAMYETPGDGYIYVTYPGLTWFREPTGGGAEQIEVQFSGGSTGYQNLAQWAENSPQGSSETAKLRAAETAVSQLISQTYTTPVDDSQLSSGEQQQAQQQLQQQGQQWQNSEQQVSSSANSPADTYEYHFLTQMNGQFDQIWTTDDCNTAENYDECDF
ncbi:MAG TPA: hypothetical protein VMC83_03445 [Streptosporangiaceae bacterium]|nr:hypothetical protein [Streptosporangiaceae bacterium]